MGLGDKILENRKKLGISQEELAEKLDVSRQTISKWETEKSAPELEKLVKLSEIFDVSVDELVKENKKIERKEEAEDKKEKCKKKFKIKRSFLFKIALVFLLIVLVICTVKFFYRKNVIENINSIYQERYKKIGEEYNATITEIIETLDNTSNYTYSKKNYTYFAEDGKRLVRADYYKTENSDNPEEIIYVDLNQIISGCYYNGVIVIDTLANTYQKIDDYYFKAPMDNYYFTYDKISLVLDILDKDNILRNWKEDKSYIWIENDCGDTTIIGDYTCYIHANCTIQDGIKEAEESTVLTMIITNHIAEEEVTPPSSEDYTVIQ